MSLSAIISECDDRVMAANYCKLKEDWFTKNLGLKHSTPSQARVKV